MLSDPSVHLIRREKLTWTYIHPFLIVCLSIFVNNLRGLCFLRILYQLSATPILLHRVIEIALFQAPPPPPPIARVGE